MVEVFVGDTLEEAMAYAVASLGPDLVVRRARKVRKNLVGKDRYEVLAGPGETAPSTDAVGSAFDALLQQAEAEEEPVQATRVIRRTTRPEPPGPVAAAPAPVVVEPVVVVPEPEPVLVVPEPEPVLVEAEPEPRALEAAPVVEAEPVAVAPEPAAPVKRAPRKAPAKAARKAPAKRPAQPAPTGWSRQRLADLGLPEAVLAGLPAEDPSSDLHWAAALAEAIDAVLPPAAVLSEDSPVVVDGYGLKGVLGILDAATRGFTPGTLTLEGRTVPASATEMALVVRQAVLS